MAHIEDYSPEQLRSLAAKKERAAAPDVVDVSLARSPSPGGWPTEVTLNGHTFHTVRGLSDDWEFVEMVSDFDRLVEAGDSGANLVAKEIVRYAYVEPYEDIIAALRTMHPEDERPHIHTEDIAALISGAVPKVPEG